MTCAIGMGLKGEQQDLPPLEWHPGLPGLWTELPPQGQHTPVGLLLVLAESGSAGEGSPFPLIVTGRDRCLGGVRARSWQHLPPCSCPRGLTRRK